MLNLQLARKYSMALFEIAQEEDKLEVYGKELAGICADVKSVDKLQGFFFNPQVQPKDKKELLKKLFEGEISQTVLNFLYILADKRRLPILFAIEADYKALSYQARGIVVADVTSAKGMSEAQASALTAKLGEVTGKTVKLRQHEDARIIGGLIVKIGDKRIDGSVTGRLEKLRAELMAF